MSDNLNSERHEKDHSIAHLNSGRRSTDRVVKIWEDATDKKTIPGVLDSTLWDNCFLLAMDEVIDCCVIIDHGEKAGAGLNLSNQHSKNLRNLPPRLRDLIFTLGQKCIKDRSPCSYSQESNISEEIPAKQYRLAVVPLLPANERDRGSTYQVTSVLGVFTYH